MPTEYWGQLLGLVGRAVGMLRSILARSQATLGVQNYRLAGPPRTEMVHHERHWKAVRSAGHLGPQNVSCGLRELSN